MGKVITVASGKGGTGKTTAVAAISSCLAALGHRTLCLDFDAGMRNLDLSLCMADFAVADFMDVLGGRMKISEACHEHMRIPNLFFLAAPVVYEPADSDFAAVRLMLHAIRNKFDYCFIDSPAGIGPGFKLAHAGADMSIIVTTGELPAMRDAQRAVTEIRDMGVEEIRLLVNRVLPKHFKQVRSTIDDVIDTVGLQLLGIIREDDSVFLSLHKNTPLILFKKKHAAYDFLDAARRITGEQVPLRVR